MVCLALLAAAVSAQSCSYSRQNHTATLANVQPKGCLKNVINATTGGDAELAKMITPECFNKLSLALTNHTGAAGCTPRTFTVAFVDKDKCAQGFDEIAEGTLNSTRTPGVFTAGGTFTTGTPFKGTLNARNQMTVTVEGSKCELTYSLKAVGKPTAVDGDEAKAAESPAAGAKPSADSKAPAAAPAPGAKSSAAAGSASLLLVLLCAVLAALL